MALVRVKVKTQSCAWVSYNRANRTLKLTNTWDRRVSVSALLTDLGWSSLADRREQSRLAMIYNIHHGLVAVNQGHQYTSRPRGGHLMHLPYGGPRLVRVCFFAIFKDPAKIVLFFRVLKTPKLWEFRVLKIML